MTGLRGQVREYLALRRAMGFKMEKYGLLLDSLACHLEAAGLTTVTVQAAVEWAMLPQDAHPNRWKQRLDAARGFARYLAASGPAAEIPPHGLLAARPNRHQPYLFTGQEIAVLLKAAGQHRWHLPAVTYPALFGLIAATGCRLGEAVRLDDADVGLDEAMITIRDSKYGKSRRIPVDPTVTAALRHYLDRRRSLRPAPNAPARDQAHHPPRQRRVPPDHRGDRDRSERREPPENPRPEALCGQLGYAPGRDVSAGRGGGARVAVRIILLCWGQCPSESSQATRDESCVQSGRASGVSGS